MKAWSCPITPGNKRLLKVFLVLTGFYFLSSIFCVRAEEQEQEKEHPLRTIQVAVPKEHPVVGERLSFRGRWFGIPVGYGFIEVKEMAEVNGRKAYHIEAQGHTNEVLSAFYPIHDFVESYLDVQTLRPLRFEKHQREGLYRADEVVVFDYARAIAHYHSLLNGSEKTITLPDEFQDLISTLYWFRRQKVTPGGKISANIYTDEKIYQTDILIRQPIMLDLLKRGQFPCLVVEPKASFKGFLVKRGRIWAYLTADENRLPLLIKATTPWGAMAAVLDKSSIESAGIKSNLRTQAPETPRK